MTVASNPNLTGGRRGKAVVPTVAPRCGLAAVAAQALGMTENALANRFKSGAWPEHLRVRDGRQWVYHIDAILGFLFERGEQK